MKDSPPWARLKDVAAKRRDESAQRVAGAMRIRDEAQRKLKMLLDYRSEYEERMRANANRGIDAASLANYRTFLAQLERAVEQQRENLATAQRELDRTTQVWSEDRRRTETYQVLDDRVLDAKAEQDRRIEQRRADEWVAQNRRGTRRFPR